jgi:hypothetical protein
MDFSSAILEGTTQSLHLELQRSRLGQQPVYHILQFLSSFGADFGIGQSLSFGADFGIGQSLFPG